MHFGLKLEVVGIVHDATYFSADSFIKHRVVRGTILYSKYSNFLSNWFLLQMINSHKLASIYIHTLMVIVGA